MLRHHLSRVRQPGVERCEQRFRWNVQHGVPTKASVNALRDLPCPVVPRGIWVEKRQHSTLDAVATRHKAFHLNLAQVASLGDVETVWQLHHSAGRKRMRHERIHESNFFRLPFAMSSRRTDSDRIQQQAILGNRRVGINVVVDTDLT